MFSIVNKQNEFEESSSNTRRITEFLITKSIRERVNVLSFILGISIPVSTGFSNGAFPNETSNEFDNNYYCELKKTLLELRSNNLVFPIETILNNAKGIYQYRASINKFTTFDVLYSYLSANRESNMYPEGLTAVELDVIKNAYDTTLINTLLQINESPWVLDEYKRFDILLDEAINKISPTLKYDINLTLWRRVLTDVRNLTRVCKNYNEQHLSPDKYKIFLNVFTSILAKRNSGILENSDLYVEVLENFKLKYDDPLSRTDKFGIESVNVAGSEEIIFYSDGVEDVIEYETLDNLAIAMVNTISTFKGDVNAIERHISHEENYGVEDFKDIMQKILTMLSTHIGLVIPAVLAMILALLYFLIKQGKKEDKGEGITTALNKILDERKKVSAHLPTKQELGINTVPAAAAFNNLLNTYNTKLDHQVLSRAPGYTVSGIEATLIAHVKAASELTTQLGEMWEQFNHIINSGLHPREVGESVKRIESLFLQYDFHKLHYTLQPLFTFVTRNGGHAPYESPIYEIANRAVTFRPAMGNAFWAGFYNLPDKRPAATLPHLEPYSVHGEKGSIDYKIEDDITKFEEINGEVLTKYIQECNRKKASINELVVAIGRTKDTLNSNLRSSVDPKEADLVCWSNKTELIGQPYRSALSHINKATDALFNIGDISTGLINRYAFTSRLQGVTKVGESILDVYAIIKRIKEIKNAHNVYRSYLLAEEKEYNAALKKAGHI